MACAECGVEILAIDADIDPRLLELRLRAQCHHDVPPDVARSLWMTGMRWTLPVVDGAGVIAAERARQVHEEGYTPEHDAEHDADSALAWAAWCLIDVALSGRDGQEAPRMWPWGADSWRPDHTPERRLVIAGALIAAEIDRRLLATRVAGSTKGRDA